VISYAPYTSQVALPSIQDRASRHFVLIEARPENFTYSSEPRQVVLYDSTGAEEPRVITPSEESWQAAALYQKDGGGPVILAAASGKFVISEGGTSWHAVTELTNAGVADNLDVDTGGRFSTGLFAPVILGNDEWPFVVTTKQHGVWAIRRNGQAKALWKTSPARAIGRNAAGDRFLISAGNAIWIGTLDGTLTKIADLTGTQAALAGWVTSKGTAYVERMLADGRTLYVTNNMMLEPTRHCGAGIGQPVGRAAAAAHVRRPDPRLRGRVDRRPRTGQADHALAPHALYRAGGDVERGRGAAGRGADPRPLRRDAADPGAPRARRGSSRTCSVRSSG
jgi:hypothetical protein